MVRLFVTVGECLPSVAQQWIPVTKVALPFYNSSQSVTAKDSFRSLLAMVLLFVTMGECLPSVA
jgi:hypothetical protein